MKNYLFFFGVIVLASSLVAGCAETAIQEIKKPELLIKIRDDSGKIISGATVRLYKQVSDSGLTQLSDSTGLVFFSGLDVALYYWLAQKGCKTNRTSQMTLNRVLVPGGAHYGYSVLAETGTLKVVNNAAEPYKVSDSVFNFTVKKDTPYITHLRVRSYLIHSEKLSTPGIGKDTLIRIRCGDTSIINLPY